MGTSSFPAFNANEWYYIALNGDKKNVIRSTSLFDNDEQSGATYMQNTDFSNPGQRWQLFPVDSNAYMLRSNDSTYNGQPVGFMGTKLNKTDDTTMVSLMRSDGADDAFITWTLSPSKEDKAYYLINKAMGPGWRVRVGGPRGTTIFMDDKLDDADETQRFTFWPVDLAINDERYSKINVSAYDPLQRNVLTLSS
jgi:hypothetical protein